MNKFMLVIVIILSVAVVLLSGAVFYFSRCQCQGRFSPGNRMNMRMPCPFGQEQSLPGMPPMPNAGGQSGMMPPGGQPNRMGGPGMGGEQQGQRPQGGPSMGAGKPGRGQQGGPGLSGQQTGSRQGQSGSKEQVSQLMQEARQEAQNYFMGQNRKPEHQEMLNKVKELMTQKMNAQGISQDIQQKVFSSMDQMSPPQPSQPRP